MSKAAPEPTTRSVVVRTAILAGVYTLLIFAAVLAFAWDITFLAMALVMLAMILIAVSLIFLIVALWDRQVVNALAWILSAIPVYLILGTELIGRANYYADRFRIEITKGQMLNQAVETQQRGEPRFFMTLWQGRDFPYPSLLIFDESDELLLSDALQSPAWRERTKSHLGEYFQNCAIGIQNLGDHFYLFECQFMLADQPAR